GLAAGSTAVTVAVGAPHLVCRFTNDTEEAVAGDTEMLVGVSVTNEGGLPAFSPELTLEVPEGWTIVSGDNPRTLTTLQGGGGSVTVGWTLRSDDGESATLSLGASAATTGFGETFDGDAVQADVVLDTTPPTGFVFINSGDSAVGGHEVSLQVVGLDNATGVTRMRLRNSGESWGEWEDFTQVVEWTLADGEGDRTVEMQLEDGVGNQSSTIESSILVDETPPTGSMLLNDGAVYLMPWVTVVAETASTDPGGSGIDAFRYRWDGGPWSSWVDPEEGPEFSLERGPEGPVLAEGQMRDLAGNLSLPMPATTHLVRVAPPDLTSLSSRFGALDDSDDIDDLVLHLVAGDLLSVGVKGKPRVRKADVTVSVDVYGPGGDRLVDGRFPVTGRKLGVKKLPVVSTGLHYVVLRSQGADAEEGIDYALKPKIKRQKSTTKVSGVAATDGETASVSFEAASGDLLSASFSGPVTAAELEDPDGGRTALELTIKGDGTKAKLAPVRLDGVTGTWTLHLGSQANVKVKLKRKPSKDGKSFESDSP
ncbi:MAG: hypothetical protein ACYTG4_11840, partial [Planctomycetota bacterium]